MIDLSDYTQERRRLLRQRGACCVYVIGPSKGEPCKIGIAEDVANRLFALQSGNWIDLRLHFVLWTPGKIIAFAVEQHAHALLKQAGKWRGREWVNVSVEWARKTVETAAETKYPGVHFRRHEDILRTVPAKPEIDPLFREEEHERRSNA